MKISIGAVLAAASLLASAQNAQAYDFSVGNKAGGATVTYAHIGTVSAFCHDRTPVDVNNGDPPLTFGNYVGGSTAPGCLIDNAGMVTAQGTYNWNGLGVGGGTFTLLWDLTQELYVCPYDATCTE